MTKQYLISNGQVPKKEFDLESRTLKFAAECITLSKLIMKDPINVQISTQLVRSSSSVGANYREANEAMTKKEFYYRIGIARRESKESKYWLELLLHANSSLIKETRSLIDEALQLTKIFSSIALGYK